MMEYLYEISLNGLKDLKHVEWFLNHRNDYEFTIPKANELLTSLLYKMEKKNIFYSDIVSEYNQLIAICENNPFNYRYDILALTNKGMTTANINYYFIKVKDKENNDYIVPYQYILDDPIEHDLNQVKNYFDNQLHDNQKEVVENFQALESHYTKYWQSGVSNAIDRYKTVAYGKSYHLVKKALQFILYNIILFKIMHEAQFINVITHFWQFFSSNSEALYSANQVFSGHLYLGIIAIVLIIYFIYLDLCYIYGLYYLIFVKRKYDHVYKHHQKVLTLYKQFYQDWQESKRQPLSSQIAKLKHRNNVYIALINKVSRKYNFYEIRPVRAGKRKLKKIKGIINVDIPYTKFYKTPMKKQYIKLLLLLIFVEAICNVSMIIRYPG